MSFSSSSNQITQSGTDSDLSGISGVGGVTVTTVGSTGFKVYTITRKFRVNGTLTIDPSKEMLVIDNNKKVNCYITGRLNLGNGETASGQSASGVTAGRLYSPGTALICGSDGPACCWNGALRVASSGTLALYGATMRVRGVINFNSGTSFISRDGVIIVEESSSIGNNVVRIRVDATTGVDIIGLRTYRVQFDILSADPFTNFRGYDGRDIPIAVEASPNASNSSLRGTRVDVRDLPDFRAYASAAVNNWRGAQDLRIINSEAGSATICNPDQVPAVPTAGEGALGARIFHEATITVTDEAGAAIENARVYTSDTDHSLRVRITTTGSTVVDETSDRTYSSLTNSSGLLTHTVLTGVWYRKDEVNDLTAPNGNEILDIRGKTNTAGTDDFDFHVHAYGYISTSFEAILKGKSAYERTIILRSDPTISEEDKATVDAYTELETAEKVYDAIQSAKVDDPTLGGLGASIVERSGKTLDFGSLDIILTSTAKGITFNTDNTALSLSLDTENLEANIRTTGTVNSSITGLNGFISDSSGTTSIVTVRSVTEGVDFTAFSSDGTSLGGADNSSTDWNLTLTAAQSTAGLKFLCKRLGYAPKILTLDASAGGALLVDFGDIQENLLPSGASMRVSLDVSEYNDLNINFGLTDLTAPTMTIQIPNRQVRVQQVYEAVEQALSRSAGKKFLAFGGRQVTIDLSPTAGDSLYLNFSGNKLDAGASSPNAQLIGTAWHPDGQPILGDGTDPIIASGVNLSILSEAISRAVLWRDIDTNQVGDQSLAGEVLAATSAVTSLTHGNAALKALIDALPDPATEAQVNSARDTITTAISGLPDPATEAEVNSARDAITTAISGLPTPLTLTQIETIRDAILGAVNPSIDGDLDRNEVLRRLLAVVAGNTTPDTEGVAYLREDGATAEVAYDVSEEGIRTKRTG